jgi:hypothetical protein
MENEQETNIETGQTKQWLQDNLRIIISILIVVAIAGGIYSYSKRSQSPAQDLASEITTGQGEGAVEGMVAGDEIITAAKEKEESGVAAATSQETEASFVETAGRGDSMTKLARMALANYLEKNPDSTLTPEHKIYIEDYLRKNIPPQRVFVGTSLEFSKDLIQGAITKSKTLNDKQLKNLHKYSVMVPSLT